MSPTSSTFKLENSVAGGPWTVIEEGKSTKVAGDTAYQPGGDVSAPVPVKEVKPTTEVSDISGTYTLVSINGNKLPFSFPAGAVIRSGVFTINNDGTCSSKVTFSTPSGADSSREVSASYTREGSRLTMKWTGAGTTIGTVEGTTFTMDNEGVIMAYRK